MSALGCRFNLSMQHFVGKPLSGEKLNFSELNVPCNFGKSHLQLGNLGWRTTMTENDDDLAKNDEDIAASETDDASIDATSASEAGKSKTTSGVQWEQTSDPLAGVKRGAADMLGKMEGRTVSMKIYVGSIVGVILLMLLARCGG